MKFTKSVFFTGAILVCLLIACKQGGAGKTSTEHVLQDSSLLPALPEVPDSLAEPKERAAYITAHYWDSFTFGDTSIRYSNDLLEQKLADFLGIARLAPPAVAAGSIRSMLKKAGSDKNISKEFYTLYEKYLYDPNSPMRNEDLYIAVAEQMLKSDVLTADEKVRPLHQLKMARRNRTNTLAVNFKFRRADGIPQSMHAVKSEYLILLFYDPLCHSCQAVMAEMRGSDVLNKGLASGRIKLLAVYPDEDLRAWREHLPSMPDSWIKAYDGEQAIITRKLYDIRARPTLYLLDRNKKVILKDAPFALIADSLQHIS